MLRLIRTAANDCKGLDSLDPGGPYRPIAVTQLAGRRAPAQAIH